MSKKVIKFRFINIIAIILVIIVTIISSVLIVKNINKKNEQEANKIASFNLFCNKFV